MTHRCPIRTCERDDIPDHLYMCLGHWRMVPEPIKRAVNRAYHGAGVGSGELVAAHRLAVRAVNGQLGIQIPPEESPHAHREDQRRAAEGR
jgi:hypothetical protein